MAAAKSRLRFPRESRLKDGREFARLKTKGERLVRGCLIANWLNLERNDSSRVGIITTRKLGTAVQRNRARRLLREAFRLHQHDLIGPVHLVLVARPGIKRLCFHDVERDFLAVMRHAGLWKQQEKI